MYIDTFVGFQAMVILAWSPSGSLIALFDGDVFRRVLTIFITSAFLNLLQGILQCSQSFEFVFPCLWCQVLFLSQIFNHPFSFFVCVWHLYKYLSVFMVATLFNIISPPF